jgi:hypothetical protein
MATFREFLDRQKFDWNSGTILIQWTTSGCKDTDGTDIERSGWDDITGASFIMFDHPILDREFSDDYGGPECPRFVAEDKEAIYFPGTYDGSTWCDKVYKELDRYLDWKNLETPYVGGG